ncbi:hypothetical protein CDL15_Pgr018276 [Punica granatum]|nr:hypothetical protein CDL15_Pgr018276 [Punica granatum]
MADREGGAPGGLKEARLGLAERKGRTSVSSYVVSGEGSSRGCCGSVMTRQRPREESRSTELSLTVSYWWGREARRRADGDNGLTSEGGELVRTRA